MSPRAAWRLEALGFQRVYDYVAGKVEWLAFGLPREGTATAEPTAGAAAQRDVPTAGLDDRLHDVRERVGAAGWDTCVVVNEQRVVLGRIGRSALRGSNDTSASAVMTEGPSTIRPNTLLSVELERMTARNLTSVVVTTPDGRLFGVLRLADAQRLA